MRKPLTAILGLLLIAGVMSTATGRMSQAWAAQAHPHIYDAYRLLKRSHFVLKHACRQLGGHRAAADQQIELALNEIQAAIAMDHGTLPAVPEAPGIEITPGQLHPYIHDALRQCRQAKAQLAAAAQDFGGHRTKAIQYIDAAIAQLQAAAQEPRCTS